MKELLRLILRFLVIIFIEAASLLLTAWIVPGMALLAEDTAGILNAATSVAIVLAVLNLLVRPLLVLITLPISIVTVGFFTLLINALMLWLAAIVLPYFEVPNFWVALLGAIVLAIINTAITSLTTIDDDFAFYDGVVQWLSRHRQPEEAVGQGRGIVMLEIDGLSYARARKAIELGLMPTLQRLMRDGTHALSHVDCGLPSQTSSCQAGIMYGDNHNIPAFRWFDKQQGKLYVSNNFDDAAELEGRFANGSGLLRRGTSINNLMSGDAQKSFLTISTIRETINGRGPSEDFYLVFVNPYFFIRAFVLTLWDILVELLQALRQRLRNEQPRINRLEKAYPVLRGLTNVLLRDLSTYTVILNVMRGSPAIYATFLGYDEIAHHAGPDSKDALNSLRGFDTQLRRILDVLERKAQRLYDVFVLSDHGQSAGATFKQRYGQSLTALIESLVREGAKVAEIDATENARGQTAVLLAEIRELQRTTDMGRVGSATLTRASRSLERRLQPEEMSVPMGTDVIICVSGNLANVYFDLHPGKVSMKELEEANPGLLHALVAHPGIGLVLTYEDDGDPWVLGKDGAYNLRDGVLTGVNPLIPYGDTALRADQLLRLASFPNAGDLIIISTLYPDGTVAAFEELVGNHGGLGGQQTDAFLFHPVDLRVPPTRNATDVYPLLNGRRGLPGQPLHSRRPAASEVNPWAPSVLWQGAKDVTELLSRAARALRLDRIVFQEVADDPYAMGQALLLMTVLALGTGVQLALQTELLSSSLLRFVSGFAGQLLGWALFALLAVWAGSVLRGQGGYTRALRTIAFAEVAVVIRWLAILPWVGPLLLLAGILMEWLTAWLALQEALDLSRWRALLIPFLGVMLIFVLIGLILMVIGGFELTLETLRMRLQLP